MNPKLKDYSLDRMTRGAILAKENVISENANGTFSVPSQTVEEIAYLVRMIDGKWVCNCIDFKERHDQIGLCYHIHAVKFWIATQVEIKHEPKPKVFSPDSIQCQKCGSIRVWKYGHDAEKQIFKCKDCKTKFRYSLLKKAKYSPETVSLTLDLYFSGMSLAKIANTLNRNYDMKLGKCSVYRWIQKFIPQISEYVNSLSPQLSDTWHGDELFVKMKKGIDYTTSDRRKFEHIAFMWNVMDKKTRFLLASSLSKFRDNKGAQQAFREAREIAKGQWPEKILVDGAGAYKHIGMGLHVKGWNPEVIAKAGIKKPHANNNRIERMNGTLRERVKVQRGWKSMETPIAEGQRIHYNFVKPHQSLEGMTPAQRAGIPIENKWLELLKKSLISSRKDN
jgi:transposase-like protein